MLYKIYELLTQEKLNYKIRLKKILTGEKKEELI